MEVNEAKEKGVKTLEDYDRLYPHALDDIKEWFRMYKTYEGKKENTFTQAGQILSREKTLEIIFDTNRQYRALFENSDDKQNFWLGNKQD